MTAVPRPSMRVATVRDAPNIATVHVLSWKAAYQGLLPQDYLDQLDVCERTTRWQQRLRVNDWSKGGVVVAVPGPSVLGFTGFGATRDDDEDATVTGEIKQIYLLPEAWGKGLGQRLMSSALKRLAEAGYAQVTIWALSTNARARRFYEKTGWATDGATRSDDVNGFPITEVRYRKDLP